MMDERPIDDRDLTRYLLGTLPGDRAEALDELSIADEAFAGRLRAAEHDLADAYARGALSADDRGRYERIVLSTGSGRDDVRLARAFAAREHRDHQAVWRFRGGWLAAAAALILAAAGVAILVRRPEPPATARTILVPFPAGPSQPAAPSFVALTLAAPRRAIDEPPALAIPAGTQEVRLTLRLEPTPFSRFDLVIRNLETRGVAWQARGVSSSSDADGPFLSVTVPAQALPPARFAIDVHGAGRGTTDLVGMYPITVR